MTLPANGNAPLSTPSHYQEHVSLPRGVVAYQEVTTTQSGIGQTPTDITGLTVTFTAVAGRRYKMSILVPVQVSTANATCNVYIADGAGTSIILPGSTFGPASSYLTMVAFVVKTLTAGSQTIKGRLFCSVGTASVTASPNQPATLLVEDVGQ